MYSLEHLRILARAYLALTGISERRLGNQILNRKFITGLLAGGDVLTSSAERASQFFDENWPEDSAWPHAVPRKSAAHLSPHQGCTAAAP